MESEKKQVRTGNFERGREDFLQYLLDNGYSKGNIKNYRWEINCIGKYMNEHDQLEYTEDVGKAYLAEIMKSGSYTKKVLKSLECTLRRFDCFMTQGEYAIKKPYGCKEVSLQFSEGLANYLGYLERRGLSKSTINMQRFVLTKALIKLNDARVQSFSEIQPEIIYDVFEKTYDKQNFCTSIRGLLRYLFEIGIIKSDYSVVVPTIRKPQPIPSVYTEAETIKLLEGAEANATSGKRSDAIILLALRLGMRSRDIADLKFENLDFNRKIISFIQSKTQLPQRLELLSEVEEALKLYISTARQNSDIPNVFLSLKPPTRPITSSSIYHMVSNRLKISGVNVGERKRGAHSLRMTLASELVAEVVPYDVVRKILGHEDPVSIKHYVQFDIEALRLCSIAIPPITGKLAKYMEMRLGGAVL